MSNGRICTRLSAVERPHLGGPHSRAMTMDILSLSGVSKTFDNGVQAISPLDLDVAAGEFVSLVGPSGCGKSTALRLIAGLERPSAGTVAFEGGRPGIGFVFQEPTLMPWAGALANARLALDLKGVARA